MRHRIGLGISTKIITELEGNPEKGRLLSSCSNPTEQFAPKSELAGVWIQKPMVGRTMMTKTWLGLHKEAELLLLLVVLAMLGWGCGASKQPAQGAPSGGASSGETAAESGSKKTSLYEHSENAIIEGKAHPANEQNDDKPGLKGVRFPFGELQDYGLPEHLAESGRKVSLPG